MSAGILDDDAPATLVAYEIDSGLGGVYWELYDEDRPHDTFVATVESEDFGDYIAEMLTNGYVSDILVNTYESWLMEQLNHSDYL